MATALLGGLLSLQGAELAGWLPMAAWLGAAGAFAAAASIWRLA